MGCCIPKKKSISIFTMNKKSNTQIKTTKCEQSNEKLYLNKSMACIELQKYYLPNPFENTRIISPLLTGFKAPLQSQITESEKCNNKNKNKIRNSMSKLKKLSFMEVNNCPKFFISSKICNIKMNDKK